MVTVYSAPSCIQCTMTKQELHKRGIPFDSLSVVDMPEELLGRGFRSAPVVVAGDQAWSGFRPDLIRQIQ